MNTCPSCGADVTGKKFCASCGHAVQATGQSGVSGVHGTSCPQCGGEVNAGASFCMHCGTSLRPQSSPVGSTVPATTLCPVCQASVPRSSTFCTSCGHDMHAPATPAAPLYCNACGQQNAPSMRFCGGCGNALGASSSPAYQQQAGYTPQYQQPQQMQQYQPQSYGQPQYPQQQQYQQPQPYGQPQYPQQYNQGGYPQQPMMGQGPMVLRCPVCMAIAPVGTPTCRGCQGSLLNVVPTPANMPASGQQQPGGFLQGNAGKYAMGALGGAAAVIGGEMLFNGLENSIENRVEGDMGYGDNYRHHHHHREGGEGLLGELGRLADDVGL